MLGLVRVNGVLDYGGEMSARSPERRVYKTPVFVLRAIEIKRIKQ